MGLAVYHLDVEDEEVDRHVVILLGTVACGPGNCLGGNLKTATTDTVDSPEVLLRGQMVV